MNPLDWAALIGLIATLYICWRAHKLLRQREKAEQNKRDGEVLRGSATESAKNKNWKDM
ncbi:MAG: hypothetical protein HYZ07_00085 [Candidatus Harrisonbacteria bacterium]|nr:hypothetical protein [Candidatus Harrisonbacteria bacterium]